MSKKVRVSRTGTRRIFSALLCLALCVCFSSCSLFRLYAGRVYYTDPQRTVELTSDTLTIQSNSYKVK